MLAVITVNYGLDENDGINDQQISLRDAIGHADPGDTINFAGSLNGATIALTLGELGIEESLTIDASMLANGITLDAGDTTAQQGDGIRIFNITDPTGGVAPPLVTLKKLTLKRGDVIGEGGAIRSLSRLNLQSCTFVDNEAIGFGGAVSCDGQLDIQDSTFSNNKTNNEGGAVFAGLIGSTMAVANSVFTTNRSHTGGALSVGLHQGSTLQIDRCVFEDNNALARGGAAILFSPDGSASITRSVFARNRAEGDGGAIMADLIADAELTIADSLISGNTARNGGGVAALYPHEEGGDLILQRSRLENNEASNRGGGLFVRAGYASNLAIEDSVITGNKAGISLSPGFGDISNSGGGVYAFLTGQSGFNPTVMTIAGTEISANIAGAHGGGVAICSKRGSDAAEIRLGLQNSTVSGNRAGRTTASNPYPGTGGGLHLAVFDGLVQGTVVNQALDTRSHNVTITNNVSGQGAGVWSLLPTIAGSRNDVRFINSIVSANSTHAPAVPSNIFGSVNVNDSVFNILGSDNAPANANTVTWDHVTHAARELKDSVQGNNIFNDTPQLSALAWNGGPVQVRTHALLAGSPAIDAGSNALAVVPFTTTPLATDQRGPGFARSFDHSGVSIPGKGPVDIGAYETALAKVISVVVTNPNAVHTYDFATATYNGQSVVGSGNQLRTVPVGNADTVKVKFSERVSNISQASLKLTGLTTVTVPAPHSTSPYVFDSATNTATWRFNAPLAADQYVVAISPTVTNTAGDALDGEWTNPLDITTTNSLVSEFPSGNGTAGGVFRFVVTILPGDANLTNNVDGNDYLLLSQNWGGPGKTFVQGDFDGNSYVSSMDIQTWSINNGRLAPKLIFADFNGDGVVTLADGAILNAHYGQWPASHADGDTDGDTDVDGNDHLIFQRQLGMQLTWVGDPMP